MYWQGAAALLLGASTYIPQVAAQVITITQYPSTCSAIYTSGTRSVTIVQSTVTVSPVPWNDNMANGGTGFVLQALPDTTGATKRQAPVPRWVLPNGYLSTDGSKAARYMIMNHQLTTATGGWISTFEGIPYGTFAASSTVGNLNTTFKITDGKLVWSNVAFTDGMAKLFQTPDGEKDAPHIIARFYGTINSAWVPYSLYARPVNAATEGTSPPPGMSSTAIVSSMGDGMSSMQPPTSASPYQTPSYTYEPTTGGQGGQSSGSSGASVVTSPTGGNTVTSGQGSSPSSSAAQSSPAPSSSSLPTSPDGICGGDTDFVCLGSDCCGQLWNLLVGFYQLHGDDLERDSDFLPARHFNTLVVKPCTGGKHDVPVVYVDVDVYVHVDVDVDVHGDVFTTIEPSYNGLTVSDENDVQYTIGCAQDTTIGMYASETVETGFNECFGLCDARPECMAFTYLGSVNGVGPGICYFKDQMVDFVPVNNGERMVSGLRLMAAPGSSSSVAVSSSTAPNYSTYTATATPIGPDNPGGPQSRTSSSSSVDAGMASSTSTSMSMSGMSDMTSSSSAAPSPTMPVSPNGHCGTQGNGGSPEGFTCEASLFGPCCSLNGFCGYNADYCLAGCQPDFGECTPQDGNPITENGECGMDWSNHTCTGGIFGPCCSTSGFCGSDQDYCAAENCDPLFGKCDEASSTSMVMSSTSMPMSSTPGSSMMVSTSDVMATSSTQMMSSSTSSSAAAAATSLCPGANGTMYTDPMGDEYIILCGMAFAPDSFNILPADNLAACINLCIQQTDEVCVGVTFGLGLCYFKASFELSSSNPDVDSAVASYMMPPEPPAYASTTGMTTSSSSSMMPSSGVAASSSTPSSSSLPAVPTTTTTMTSTTTTTTSTTSSSSPAITTTTTSTTRTTTTTTTSSTSSSAYLVLPSPTPCDFGDPVGYDEDDSYCRIDLPFPMRIYTQSDTNTFASTNGYLSLTYGSSQFASQEFPASNIPNNTVAPFFDDLYLDGSEDPPQGIFYQISGGTVTYEWYIGRGGAVGRIYHFTVRYDSAVPGVFTYTYYSTGGEVDQGEYASVGAQGKDGAGASVGKTYAYHVQSIPPGLVVVCDTNQNTCVTQS